MNTNNQTDDKKSKLSNEQKQQLKKYAVFTLMGIICAGCMWLIFAPSADEKAKQEQTAGFNADIPLPKEEGLIDDKRGAYEREQMKQKQTEQMRSLQDFSALLGDDAAKPADDLALLTDAEPASKTGSSHVASSRTPASVEQSARAYHDINRTLGNFYASPKEDPDKEQLKQELEELKSRMDENEAKRNLKEEQMEMMEKSLQMASKYVPTNTGTTGIATAHSNVAEPVPASSTNPSGRTMVVPVSQVKERAVSTLQPEIFGMEFTDTYGQPRNMGFLTATCQRNTAPKNTISACIHGDQTIVNGQNVRLRLLEPLQAGKMIIPLHTVLSGSAKIQGERLDIIVSSLEHTGTIQSIELSAYDLDGQRGIFIPNLQELNAAKEIVANMGTSAGTSINLSNDAGKQFVADMGRNLIQGTSQFVAKKIREVKVHLKAGYKVYLLSEEQLQNSVLANHQ